jgi:hypothetical protein
VSHPARAGSPDSSAPCSSRSARARTVRAAPFASLTNNPMTRYLFPEQSPRAPQNIGEVRNERPLEDAVVPQGGSRNFYILRVFCFSHHD